MLSVKRFGQIILVLLSSFLFIGKAEAGALVTDLRTSRTRIAIPADRTFPDDFASFNNISFKITNTWDMPIVITRYSITISEDDSFEMEDRVNDSLITISHMPVEPIATLQAMEMTNINQLVPLSPLFLGDRLNLSIDGNEGNTLELFTTVSVTFLKNGREFTDFYNTVTSPEPTSTLSFLALGTLGAGSALKRKLNQKSTEKETTKVG